MIRKQQTFVILITASLLLGLASCSKGTPVDSIKNVESMEKELFSTLSQPNDSLAGALMDSYESFAEEYPEHELAPEYYFRAANVARSFKQYQRALDHYKIIVDRYPNYDNIVESKFLIAFVYDNDFEDKATAEKAYREVLESHPGHLFSSQAEERLKTLHLTDDEFLEYLRNKASQASEQ